MEKRKYKPGELVVLRFDPTGNHIQKDAWHYFVKENNGALMEIRREHYTNFLGTRYYVRFLDDFVQEKFKKIIRQEFGEDDDYIFDGNFVTATPLHYIRRRLLGR